MRILSNDDEERTKIDENIPKEESTEMSQEHKSRSQKEQVLIYDLMQTNEGKYIIIEGVAKNCLKELRNRLEIKFTNDQIRIIKMDILQECERGINSLPSYLVVDDHHAREVLQRQLDIILGLIVERLELKYKMLLT